MAYELEEFGIEVATMNPGRFLIGFNDRMFQTWESWDDDPSERLFDYSRLAFPRAQFDPEPVYATMTAVAAGEVDSFRNLEPKSMIEETKHLQEVPWERKVTDGLGTRPQAIQNSYDMKPETQSLNESPPVASELILQLHSKRCLTELGGVGLTAVGGTPTSAKARYDEAERILLEEAREALAERPVPA
jgi:hypothetical protein